MKKTTLSAKRWSRLAFACDHSIRAAKKFTCRVTWKNIGQVLLRHEVRIGRAFAC